MTFKQASSFILWSFLTISIILFMSVLYFQYMNKKAEVDLTEAIKNYLKDEVELSAMLNGIEPKTNNKPTLGGFTIVLADSIAIPFTNHLIKHKLISLYLKDEYEAYCQSKSLIRNIVDGAPILVGVFSGLFLIFTFITQLNLRKSDELVNSIIDKTERINQSIELNLSNHRRYMRRTSSRISSLDSELRQVLNTYSEVLNCFIKEEYQLAPAELDSALKLWELEKAEQSAMFLRSKANPKSLEFLRKSLRHYNSLEDIPEENVTKIDSIKKAIHEAIKAIETVPKAVGDPLTKSENGSLKDPKSGKRDSRLPNGLKRFRELISKKNRS